MIYYSKVRGLGGYLGRTVGWAALGRLSGAWARAGVSTTVTLAGLFAVLAVIGAALPAAAGDLEDARDAAAHKDAALRVGAEMRFRGANGLHLEDVGKTWSSENSGLFQRSRLGFGLERGPLTAFLQVQSSSALGAASPGSDPMPLGLQQGWLRAKLPFSQELWLDAGRMQLEYGAARQIGAYDFDAVGQAFDGLRAHFGIEKRLSAEAFVAQLRPTTDDPEVRRALSGTHLSATPGELLLAQIYVLYLRDDNHSQKNDLLTMGSRIVLGPWHGLDLEAEAAVQIGESRRPESTRPTDRLAWMAATEASWSAAPGTPLKLGVFADVYSGDTDATDASERAWQTLYPSKDLVTGLLRLFETSNLLQAGLRAHWSNGSAAWPVQVQLDVRQARAAAGGAMPVAGGGTIAGVEGWHTLGHELDLRWQWQVWPRSTLMLAGAWFVSGGATLDAPTSTPLPNRVLYALLQWTSQL